MESNPTKSFVIAFDEAHQERGKIQTSLSQMANLLNENGFQCNSYAEYPITFENLNPYDILVFACPDNSKISRPEIEAIKKWVQEGGGLLMLSHAGGDRGRRSNLSELSEQFGIIFENDQVLDPVNNLGVENLPTINNFGLPHPITNQISEICYRAGCSLTISSSIITPVVSSGPNADPSESPLILAGEYEEGRVVGIGSYEMFRNRIPGGFNHTSHVQLILNIFEWLSTNKRASMNQNQETSVQSNFENATFKPPAHLSQDSQKFTSNQVSNENKIHNIPTQQFKSNIKILTNEDLISAFEDLLTEFFTFKEKMLEEFDVLQGNFMRLMKAVIATEEDIINLGEMQTQMEQSPQEPNEDLSFNTEEELDNNTREAIQSLDQFENMYKQSKAQDVVIESDNRSEQEKGSVSLHTELNKQPENKRINEQNNSTQPVTKHRTEEEVKAELESLQNKLNSIRNLTAFVEKKFAAGKLSKSKYEKQLSKLDKDAKKTRQKIQKLEEELE